MEFEENHEVPGSSSKKRRGPQGRDYMAAQGLGLGSGRSYERALFLAKRIVALREAGRTQEATLFEKAMDVSLRGTHEIAKMSEDLQQALCQIVLAGDASNLIEARRLVVEAIRQDEGAYQSPVVLQRCNNG